MSRPVTEDRLLDTRRRLSKTPLHEHGTRRALRRTIDRMALKLAMERLKGGHERA